jgi:hypothetical protein
VVFMSRFPLHLICFMHNQMIFYCPREGTQLARTKLNKMEVTNSNLISPLMQTCKKKKKKMVSYLLPHETV